MKLPKLFPLSLSRSVCRALIATLPFFSSLVVSVGVDAANATERFAAVKVTSINQRTESRKIAPGSRLDLQVGFFLSKSWNDQGRKELGIAWYLLPQDQQISEIAVQKLGTYIGRSAVRALPVGESNFDLRVAVTDHLPGIEGTYSLVAWLDPTNAVLPRGSQRVHAAPFSVEVASVSTEASGVEIAAFEPDRLALVPVAGSDTFIEGTIGIEALQIDAHNLEVSLCAVFPGSPIDSCTPLEVLRPKEGVFGSSYPIARIEKDEVVTTMFRAKLPKTPTNGELTLRAQVWTGRVGEGTPSDSRDRVISSEAAPNVFTRMSTDFERDMARQIALARKRLKQERLRGKIPNPLRVAKVRNSGAKSIDLDQVLARVTSTIPTTAPLTKVKESDSYALPTGLVSSITGSRFNMPDQDFPWLNNITVTAPPPPEKYNGKAYANLEEFLLCIPFFCGPNSKEEAGREPSQSCVRQFCGSTKEDVNFGGRNSNLLDEQIGFDKNFSGGGFGARVGVTGRAKVYHDQAISDYVAASYETGAFFGVKLFSYSVPIFEASSQSVYSPTEIGSSQTRNELKILGLVIEREDRPSNGLSVTIRKTYGIDKNADVGLGPISVDIEVQAGGSGGVTLAVEQIDILRGIVGSLTPSAGCGAKARALTDVGIGRFGIEGELNLFEDRVPATATFNVGLNVSAKSVTPQLDFDIRNELDGPNGRIKLILEIGISPLTQSFSTTLASFSTGTFVTPIYDKTTTFGSIRY